MQITVEIPDDLAAILAGSGQDLSRAALEAIALDAYRQRRLSGYQVQKMLGLASRFVLDAFLNEHQIEKYTAEDFEHDLATIRELDQKQKAKRPA